MTPLDDKLPLLFLLLALAVAVSLINSSSSSEDKLESDNKFDKTFEKDVAANGPSERGNGDRSARVKRAMTTKKPGVDPWLTFGWQLGCGHAPLDNFDYSNANTKYEEVTYGEFPSYVRLKAGRNLTQCGATLISNRHILTAGRCLEKIRGFDPIIVTLGDHQLQAKDEYEVELNFTLGKSVSKQYCYNPLHHASPEDQKIQDYALLKLPRPIRLSQYIQPACLPRNDRYKARTKMQRPVDVPVCWIIGVVGSKDGPTKLDKMRVGQTNCGNAVKKFNDTDWESRVCYKKLLPTPDFTGRKLSCQDASWAGGPVLCKNRASSWTVMGTASYVMNKLDCDNKSSTGSISEEDDQLIYTDIPKSLELFNKSCRVLLA